MNCDEKKDSRGIEKMRREFMLMGMLVLLTVSAFSTMLTHVNAQGSSVGVQTNEYFEYSVSFSGSQASSSLAYGVTNVTATVSSVTSSLVNYSMVAQYQNGTQRTVTASADVATGAQENSRNVPIVWGLVAANLTVNEPTYPNSNSWANETMLVNGRQTDHFFQSNVTDTENDTLDVYWDVATGVPLNVSELDTVTGQGVTINRTHILIGTNAWTLAVPEFPPQTVMIITTALIGVAVATALSKKKTSLPRTRIP
jgi:hypothetical protein